MNDLSTAMFIEQSLGAPCLLITVLTLFRQPRANNSEEDYSAAITVIFEYCIHIRMSLGICFNI